MDAQVRTEPKSRHPQSLSTAPRSCGTALFHPYPQPRPISITTHLGRSWLLESLHSPPSTLSVRDGEVIGFNGPKVVPIQLSHGIAYH